MILSAKPMAADQRKKRPNASSISRCASNQKHKVKKKKVGVTSYGFPMRSIVTLEWDDKKKSVIAKKNQIGISRRDFIPFVDAVPLCHNVLADVITVPQDIYKFETLSEVLSYEVWQAHLSESERNLLSELLPKEMEPNKVVQELLGGDNFYFGNPFLKWGVSLCSGKLHPDDIVRREQMIRADKKSYYLQLQNYHNHMIGNLQMWKESLSSSKEPEEEIMQKLWRSRKHGNECMPTRGTGFDDTEENLVDTPESYSWPPAERACSSDNTNLVIMHGGSQKRKDIPDSKWDNSADELKVIARHGKSEKLHKHNIQRCDGAKYMSYVKVSKEQHQRVKSSLNHSSNSIQPRSLNYVLGNLEALHIQPFEVFEEEERQKLHEHWLQLASRDVPAGFSNWNNRQSRIRQLTRSLGQEMKNRLTCWYQNKEKEDSHNMQAVPTANGEVACLHTSTREDEDKEISKGLSPEQIDIETAKYETDLEEDERQSNCMHQKQTHSGSAYLDDKNVSSPLPPNAEHLEQVSPIHVRHLTSGMNMGSLDDLSSRLSSNDEHMEKISSPGDRHLANHLKSDAQDSYVNMDSHDNVSEPASPGVEHLQQVSSLVGKHSGNHMDMDSHDTRINIGSHDTVSTNDEHLQQISSLGDKHPPNHVFLGSHDNHTGAESGPVCPMLPRYSENVNHVDIPVGQRASLPSSCNIWSADRMPDSYYHSTCVSHEYVPASNMSHGHRQGVREQSCQLVDLEVDVHRKDSQKDMLHRSSDVPFFSSYTNADRSELLQSFFKNQGCLPYHQERKQIELDFQPVSNLMMDTGQLSGHLRQQVHPSLPLDLEQKRLDDIYINQNMEENMYSDGGRYSIPRQDHVPLNIQDWGARMSAPSQSHTSRGQNWYLGENQAHAGWSGLTGGLGAGQSIASGNNSDQSLFSVLSECNELRPRSLVGPHDSMSSTERLFQSGNYGGLGGALPTSSNVVTQTNNPLNYLSHEPASVPKANTLGWMSLQHQNSGLQEPMSKPFLRSWNQ